LTGQTSTSPHTTVTISPASTQVGQPLVRATFRPAASWLRIGPAWAVIAGALSLPLGEWDATVLLRVLTALLLADPIWGAFWHSRQPAVAADDSATPPVSGRGPIPYARPDAPATRLATWLRGGSTAAEPIGAWRPVAGWPVALLLAFLLALWLGPVALALTAVAVGLSLLRLVWTRHDHAAPAVIDAGLVVGLPWLVGMVAVAGLSPTGALYAVAFGVLVWGVLRAEQGVHHARTITMVGQVMVLAVLVWQGRPLAAGLVGASFLMPWWLLAWPPETPSGTRARGAVQAWFLAAMLLSAVIRS
jgi:hypothetical protein